MNMEQVEQYHKAILKNAKDWANGQGMPLYQDDIVVIGEYLDMRIPTAFYKFESSEEPGNCIASGSYKTILNILDRMQKKILNGALDKFTENIEQDNDKAKKPSILGQVKENAASIPPSDKTNPQKNKNRLEVE